MWFILVIIFAPLIIGALYMIFIHGPFAANEKGNKLRDWIGWK